MFHTTTPIKYILNAIIAMDLRNRNIYLRFFSLYAIIIVLTISITYYFICKSKVYMIKQLDRMDFMKKYLPWLPSVIIMVIIFLFSSKPAIESSKDSMGITEFVLDVYETLWNRDIIGEKRDEVSKILEVIVRKTAHFMEYAVLGKAFSYALWKQKMAKGKKILLALMFTILYAITDEVHQLFVPGRSGRVLDVLIDSMGAIVGVTVFAILIGRTMKSSQDTRD